ncbi:bacillithiol system redox-active protein YtxJ [Lutibacter sp.]|uniref:bacillithiol system redox-active protein YtxJ n=1 Tax=Lutibacter sp. TaxID=1925666 RepID=UPI0025BE4904|nr:bacillithiol system redox-active protein YtxJ [Lutibacter sp.]MCF6182981.1 bacillithiol system redox-active protein YtxJ [Lutibacter sp.]
MGLFNSTFKSKHNYDESKTINWIPLVENNQLATILSESKITPVLIFKHSTRCGISRFVLKNFEKEYDIPSEKLQLYFLDILTFRAISNEIESKFNVRHQSPQVIILFNEEVIYHASHQQIDVSAIKDVLKLN